MEWRNYTSFYLKNYLLLYIIHSIVLNFLSSNLISPTMNTFYFHGTYIKTIPFTIYLHWLRRRIILTIQHGEVLPHVYISYVRTRQEKGQSPIQQGLLECNQCILVILSARPLLFAGPPNLISLVTFFVIKQYYLLLVPLQRHKLALTGPFCHQGDQF